ncbi:MAG: FISUMP domain-containing protein [Flavobacteriales bacterium]
MYTFIVGCGGESTVNNTASADTTVASSNAVQQEQQVAVSAPIVPAIKIGEQEWMSSDIQANTYTNGDAIPEAVNAKQWKGFSSKKEGCYRKLSNGTFIYNGYAMMDARGILPAGFQIPSSDDFKQLIKFLGAGNSQTGKATKAMANYSISVEDWVESSEGGGLETITVKGAGGKGFNAKEGGYVYDHGETGSEGGCSYWWTSTASGKNFGVVDIGYCSQDLGGGFGSYSADHGFAVRAIKK